MRLLFGFLSVALLTAALLPAQSQLSGRRAPGFSLSDYETVPHDIADLRGKLVLVEFMQTDCPQCQKFAGILEEIRNKYGDRVAILSIVNPPTNVDMVKEFAKAHNLSYPILFDCGQVAASYFKASPQNPSFHIPHVFLVDADGIIFKDFGFNLKNKEIFEGKQLFDEVERYFTSYRPAPSAE